MPGRTGREGGQAESGRGGGSRRRALPVRSCPGCLRPTRTSGCRWSGPDGGRGQSDPKGSPPSLPPRGSWTLPAGRQAAGHGQGRWPRGGPPVRGRAAGQGQGRRSGAGPPVTGRAAGQGQVRHAGAATALLPLPPCAAGTDPKAPAPGSRATSFLRPKLPTHAVESTQLPARGALAGPRLNSNWATPLEATLSRTRPGGASGTCALGPSESAGSPGPRPAPAQETLRRHPLCPAQRLHPLPAWVVSHMLVPLPNRPVPVPLFCL